MSNFWLNLPSQTSGGGSGSNPGAANLASSGIGGVTGTLPIENGGTGQSVKNIAFDALAPTFTEQDMIYYTGGTNQPLSVGTPGQSLAIDGQGAISWRDAPLSVMVAQ